MKTRAIQIDAPTNTPAIVKSLSLKESEMNIILETHTSEKVTPEHSVAYNNFSSAVDQSGHLSLNLNKQTAPPVAIASDDLLNLKGNTHPFFQKKPPSVMHIEDTLFQ